MSIIEVSAAALAVFALGAAFGAWVRRRFGEYRGSLYRYDMARQLYGASLALRRLSECDNSHVPGDCPLCGSEAKP